MKNKEIILLIEELKQQVEECRDRDSSNYIDSLLKRTDWIINQLNVNNGVLDGVIVSGKDCKIPMREFGSDKCLICGKQFKDH